MKRLIIFLLIVIGGTPRIVAQMDSTQFFFDKFEEGLVYFKDGRQFRVPMNYNLVIKKFLFIDKNDNNNIKEFLEPEMVVTIKIGDRVFLPTEDGATEVLQTQPPIFVQYKGAVRWEGKQVGYGGRSETSAVDSYSSLQSGSTVHKLETEKLMLTSVSKIFRIERSGKRYRFSNDKQFLKAYPDHRDALKKYIEENNIDFNSVERVLQLYNYAASL